ncbi:dienelactone hydrolase family protein [Frankia sp. AiPs1]|uniref:dienelactone hydrolase family protein n=1 Tax=Frankia sp. AiPs1 TaxID=573493 RepID=UPI002043ACC2|nr:dienelactone hydrolase family protein [Frankia sp. AiPs1]MCM3922222.1 dienelactone hydrolase family protein [Frankia sp. AiPs1]
MTTVDLSGFAAVLNISPGLRAYLARPAAVDPAPAGGGTPPTRGLLRPGVIVLHEAWGLDETVRAIADRLAGRGYFALAPDLFSAGGARRCLVATVRAMSAGRGRAFDDIEAARRWLTALPACNGRVGVIGFCLGGGLALLSAGRGFEVAAVNYGPLPRELDASLRAACPVVASYGGRDRTLRGAAGRLSAALDRAGVPHDVKEYPTAGHAFLGARPDGTPSGPRVLRPVLRAAGIGPEPVAAADAWVRIERFLTEHLGA